MKFSGENIARNKTENSEVQGFINLRKPPNMNSKNSNKRVGSLQQELKTQTN